MERHNSETMMEMATDVFSNTRVESLLENNSWTLEAIERIYAQNK